MTDRYLWVATLAIVVSGCVIDNSDYDPDAGDGSDTDTDTDTDPDCQDEHHLGCNEDGEVVWFDSCDIAGDVVMGCDEEHGGCVETGDGHAECQCDDNWDPTAGCYQCETGFAGGACAVCEIGYQGSECDACADGYTLASGECVYDDWCYSDRYWLVDGDLQSIERPDLDFDIEGTVDEPVVVDKVTGLEWKRCLEGQFWSGGTCCGVSTKFYYADISDACTSSYAGNGDWRIPDLTELRTLLVFSPCVSTNENIFPEIDDLELFTSTIFQVIFGPPICRSPMLPRGWPSMPKPAPSDAFARASRPRIRRGVFSLPQTTAPQRWIPGAAWSGDAASTATPGTARNAPATEGP